MIRRLLLLLGIVMVWMWVRTLLRKRQHQVRQPGRRAAPDTPRFEGEMVRDRVCNTFLPRSKALLVHRDGEEWFFCSEDCRSTFLEAKKATH